MKKDNNKLKKFGAWIAIIILLLACCMPMFFAFGSGENAQSYFKASLAVAIMVPLLAYAMWMVYKLLNKNRKVADSDMENIIFDVGKVLVKYEWEKYLDSFGFSKEKRDKIAKAVFQSKTWDERDRGSESEEYYIEQMIKDAPEYADDIREVMRRSGETIEMMDYAETWIRYLKDKGYHIYILSNYSAYMLEKTQSELAFLKYVDGAVFSCDVKQIKPEAAIYRTLLNRYHLDPEKSVFLDDRAENCEGARKEGIHAIQFESFKQAAAELEKLGVK